MDWVAIRSNACFKKISLKNKILFLDDKITHGLESFIIKKAAFQKILRPVNFAFPQDFLWYINIIDGFNDVLGRNRNVIIYNH